MDFGTIVNNLLDQMAFFHLQPGNYAMIGVAAASDPNFLWYAAGEYLPGDYVLS